MTPSSLSENNGGEDDAQRLHEAGYTRRQVWAKWALDDFKTLYWHLTDQDKPVEDNPKIDSSFYLSADEWDEVAGAARRMSGLAVQIAAMLRQGRDE